MGGYRCFIKKGKEEEELLHSMIRRALNVQKSTLSIVGALIKHLWVEIRRVISKEKLNLADCSELCWE